MKFILFAGGTGKRFWPVSRKNSPKQFLPIVQDTPLIRLRFDILKKKFNVSDIYISTGIHYKNEVMQILPELPEENFIFEPEMRDTGPAVTLALMYVSHLYPEEIISIQWSDHLIKNPDNFTDALSFADSYIKKTNKDVLFCVPARFPSPHRGYINFGNHLESIKTNEIELYEFEKFVEKPTKEVAETYIESGKYGWNPGYWNLQASTYKNIVKKTSPQTYEICKEIVESKFSESSLSKFTQTEKTSADYMFAEYLTPEDAHVILVDMQWSDVGEWIAFKEALEESPESNVIHGNVKDLGSTDTLVYNSEDSKLLATIGLNGMVVVNTKDVTAVFHKNDNTRLKEFIKKLEEEGLERYL